MILANSQPLILAGNFERALLCVQVEHHVTELGKVLGVIVFAEEPFGRGSYLV